jgi:hypothetical protein
MPIFVFIYNSDAQRVLQEAKSILPEFQGQVKETERIGKNGRDITYDLDIPWEIVSLIPERNQGSWETGTLIKYFQCGSVVIKDMLEVPNYCRSWMVEA